MKSKRILVQLSALLLFLAGAGYFTQDRWLPAASLWWEMRQDPPLPGQNRVGNIRAVQKSDDLWAVTFDYYFVGYPKGTQAIFFTDANVKDGNQDYPISILSVTLPERGQHSVTVYLRSPGNGDHAASTDSVTAMLGAFNPPRSALGLLYGFRGRYPSGGVSATLAQHVEWPDRETIAARPENVLPRAVALIDTEDPRSLEQARTMLQALVARAPAFDPAYVELARVVLKTKGLEGMPQAESLIQSALQIRPGSVDAKLLLAHVYAHQKRFAEAEALNKELVQAAPTNLWVGTSLGEVAEMQGHEDEAIARYREVLAHPPTRDRYDRARTWTYEKLIRLLWQRKDLDGVEALYRQRVADYKEASCAAAHLAEFLVLQRGDADAALATLRAAPQGGCGDEPGRQVLGLANYLKWAKGTEPESAEALRQARALLPSGPALFYQLASADATVPVVRKLVAAGDNINAQDAESMDALTYALRSRDYATASRLLRLGARTDSLVGTDRIPVSLVPVLMQDVEGVLVLRRAGVDYSRMQFQGVTPADYARRVGNAPLLRALDPKADARGSGHA
jgi:tetratricopeptide (TPR) repeat protein